VGISATFTILGDACRKLMIFCIYFYLGISFGDIIGLHHPLVPKTRDSQNGCMVLALIPTPIDTDSL